nr:Asp-tRNA(Asn)/Glu-tRNA(Gln) amidotransferase subunit GatA [Clostridia bacterium]
MNYLDLDITEVRQLIKDKKVTSVQLVKLCLDQINKTSNLNALNSVCTDMALKRAAEIDAKIARGEDVGVLGGVPIVIKDNINMIGTTTTCSSNFLKNYVSPYNATVVQKLIDAGAVIIAKANMDEFAMGSSNETSAFGPVKNPIDPTRVPGGSSGGSACTVAAKQCFGALGTDTGGSIREPASFCGIVGLKPTYGRVSRYGVVAFASSLDQVGPLTRSVRDSALMLGVLAGYDQHDMTSSKKPVDNYLRDIDKGVKGMRIGLPKQFFTDKLSNDVRQNLDKAIQKFRSMGATIVEVDLKNVDTALAVYYIISSAEAASNLARFDGVKYGVRAKNFDDIVDLYYKSRTQGFGKEVKRRIMLGNYVLSSGYFDAFYNKAKKVQKIISKEFINAFDNCDVILAPTVATVAFKLGEKTQDPVAMYLSDIFTVPVNIAGIPAISVPCGTDESGLPVGMQLMGKHFDEAKLFRVANAYEKTTKGAK